MSTARRSRGVVVSLGVLAALVFIAALGNAISGSAFGSNSAVFAWTEGARSTVVVTFVVLAASFGIGVSLGGVAALGPSGGDALLSLLVEVFGSLPSLVVVVVLRVYLRADLLAIGVVLAVLRGLGTAKAVRADILQLDGTDFIAAARALGSGRTRLFRKHVFPYVAGPALANATFTASAVVGLDATATFLGLGTRELSWGSAIAKAALNANLAAAVAPALGLLALLGALHVLSDAVAAPWALRRRFM